MLDLNKIAEKWQDKWEKAGIFEADANPKKKKFFAHFTYPYVNAYPHIGHFYTLIQAEIMARYKRLRGFNVLMPQGWHATGSPLVSAARRVKEKEEKQLKMLADMGITDREELKKFEDPGYWIEFFAPEFQKDFRKIGISIDWRRNYITTSLNPHYDKFIRWQFNKLKEKDYVIKGEFPVVWCPKDNVPCQDHDRIEGEGETPQEFVLIKYKFGDKFIVTATLRPETIFGDTNIWINPDVEYVVAKVDQEKWIISKECAEKLKLHGKSVSIESKIRGKDFVGKDCRAPVTGKELIILPSSICNPNIATGIVRSVPSHAPFDWAALNDLQNSKSECEKYGLNFEEIRKIKPISLIKVEGMGEHPSIEISKKMGVKSHKDSALLEKATQEAYKKEFFSGVMKDNAGKYRGMPVAKAKEEIKQDMLNSRQAALMYELTGKVVCRCLTPAIIKIVSDQWFIAYGNREWKKLAHKALGKLRIYPDKSRQQLEYTIDWLRNWACTREEGLGTRLPWDGKWLIESLSDSTIYFAFYPIAHLIQKIDPELIDDNAFDYIFLKKGKKPRIKDIDKMRKEFDYWYPVDFNTSGKDLIQNHIAFSLFNHSAIFPEDRWMAGIRINGWVT
ncbi:leucine--tRNA ligase, partial [Candidatus Woesearchaeota archaeon]|nr:leucine--tRNA ligase [Candidatus Woesearchaeota archaeon]